jgi:acyl carrier protein
VGDRRAFTDTSPAPPTTAPQRVLVAAWEEVLGVHPIGVEDNFLELGGTSILAVHLAARIEATTGVRIPADEILAADTLADLARDSAIRDVKGE